MLEIRVLGTLIEKESTTPEYYPMSLNALVAACNQKTSRFPVTDYSEGDILEGIAALRVRGYAAEISGSGRVAKFAQRFTEKLNLGRQINQASAARQVNRNYAASAYGTRPARLDVQR